MVSYQAIDTEFQKLSHEDQKQKVINILEFIKDKLNFASGMKTFISSKEDISDQFLNSMYQIIMKAATQADEQQKDQHNKEIVSHISDIVLKHQEIENKEHDDADSMLNQI